MKKYIWLIFFFLLLMQPIVAQYSGTSFGWPEITGENKPWTRWWWPGSIVDKAGITQNLEKYRRAGLGGLEVTVIYGVKGLEDRFISYLSPEWMNMFVYTLNEGQRLGLGIDLANASGWPFGGPWVKPEDACRNISFRTWKLKTGEKVTEPVTFVQKPLVRAIGLKPDIRKLKYPIAENDSLQVYALDQIRFEKKLTPDVVMAFSDKGQSIDITSSLVADSSLEWTAPEGTWTIYALFSGWHGKQVERAGPGGEGDVIDHFSARATDRFLDHFSKIFENYDLSYLRSYFNDSYEVDDASGQADWTPRLAEEFRIRRGYDLLEELPALFQNEVPEKNERILSDYRQTIADLLLENYTRRWTAWANAEGKLTRNQSHGAPANILDLYAATDIPETEGYESTRLKFATSAANVTGKKLVSSESATWLNEHFSSTLSDVRKAVDLFFINGVNHIFYHGTCYSPPDQPWPGFQFYASVEFSPQNSFWNDFEGLNIYVSRAQSFLQRGTPDNDILLYFPVFDRYADYNRGMLEHFDAISPRFAGTPFRTAADLMPVRGYTYDYISDLQLGKTIFSGNRLKTEGGEYRTLVVPACRYIPLETFEKILTIANDGANIIFLGGMPENISGWADYINKTSRFSRLKSEIAFSAADSNGIKTAMYGRGRILLGNDLEKLLPHTEALQETMAKDSLSFCRRKFGNGYCYFIVNNSRNIFKGWIKPAAGAASAAIFNPMTGDFGKAAARTAQDGKTEIFAIIDPGESYIVQTFGTDISGKKYDFAEPSSPPALITGKWKIEFTEGGPVLPATLEISDLVSWTDLGGEELRNFSGTAVYTINFGKPEGKSDWWLLDLGRVCESARVRLNGKDLGIVIGPRYRVKVSNKLLKRENRLEISVSNLAINRIAYMDRNNIPWKNFYNINMSGRLKQTTRNGLFDASGLQPRASGLLGPVTITALTPVAY